MTFQKVFIVGPPDPMLSGMFAQQPEYRVTSDIKSADIICFQGGPDLHPALYNERLTNKTSFDRGRDQEDLEVWDDVGMNRPKVGICRGGQFLNVMSDGEMWQHVNNHGSPHSMTNLLELPGSVFKMGSEMDVTSDHHQMMVPNLHYGEILGITKKATLFLGASERPEPEYDTEVVFYNHTQSLCFQPHPEYNYKAFCRTYFFKLMEFFFK